MSNSVTYYRSIYLSSPCFSKEFGAGVGYISIVSLDGKTLTYCPVPKAGWSTWKRLFYREKGVEHLMADVKQ